MSDEGSPSASEAPSAAVEREAEREAEPETGAEATEVAPEAPPRRKKKRKRRVDTESAEETAEAAAPAEPDETMPAFAVGWPADPALSALVVAFEAGDYARVRREAPLLAKQTEDAAVRRAARELRRRLDPDPVAVYMLMAAAALLVFLAGWYWLHPHAQ